MRLAKKTLIIAFLSAITVTIVVAGIVILSADLERVARKRHGEWNGFSTVYGRLHNRDGQAVRLNGDVLLCGQSCFSAKTTLKGEFAFSRIPPGQYRLYGVHNDCKSEEYTMLIQEDAFNALPIPLLTDKC